MIDHSKERAETDALEQEAISLGIDIPKNPDWWWRQRKQWTLTKWGVIIGWVLGIAAILISVFKR